MKKPPVQRHPLYGEIPLVDRGGWLEPDREYKPKLPKGAVRGDVQLQNYCVAHHVPKYFYVDEERTCVQCGERFVFGAKEQKFWYETLKFNFGSEAIRCQRCRKERRTDSSLRRQLGELQKRLEKTPRDPHVLLELARTTVAYRERTGEGDLNRAIAACRAAQEEWPDSAEPLFWEARCHQLAGRTAKAQALFTKFIAGAKSHLTKLVREAERALPRTTTPESPPAE